MPYDSSSCFPNYCYPQFTTHTNLMDKKQLSTWVSDKLMKLVGISDKTVIAYVIALAGKSSSVDSLCTRLQSDAQLPQSAETLQFASLLYDKVPHKSGLSATEIARQVERDKILELEKNSKFTLVLEQEEKQASSSKKKSKSRKGEMKLRKRDDEDKWELEENSKSAAIPQYFDYKQKWKEEQEMSSRSPESADDEHDNERYESERERDLRERDEFDDRLRKRDLEKGVQDVILVNSGK